MSKDADRWAEELNEVLALQALWDDHPGWRATEQTGNGPVVDITEASKARLEVRAAYYWGRLNAERGSL